MAFLGFRRKKPSKAGIDKKQERTSKKSKALEVGNQSDTKDKTREKEVKGGVTGGKKATDYSKVLIKPRITEKAAVIAEEGNVYTFNVDPSSTKKEVAKAIEAVYKVKPTKINITKIKSKKVLRRGQYGKTAAGKKAMVYLKEGDKIEFV